MSDRFGLSTIGSIEVFHDEAAGWAIRAFSGPERTGDFGSRVSFSPDDDQHLSVTALLTVSTVLAADDYATVGDWHVDESARIIWIDARLASESLAPNPPSIASVDAVMDAERRWGRADFGTQ